MTHAVGMGHPFNFFAQTAALFNFWNFGGDHRAIDNTSNGHANDVTNIQDTSSPPFSIHNDGRKSNDKERDLIVDLPGLYFDPGFAQYSGYFNVDPSNNRNLFYWYVESQGNPETDPVIFWTNGGPGCSGLYAFAVEHGPFFWTVDGVLFANPYSWNLHANILYVETPVGVGFSYSDVEDDYTTGDAQTALDNYVLIRKFLERFPERQSNDFYISSESYGGHYIPGLTLEILKRNKAAKDDSSKIINFQGAMVGNPFVDPYTNDITQFQTWYDHGLLPWPLYRNFVNNCHHPKRLYSPECLDYMDLMLTEVGKGISPYALDYPVCLEKKFKVKTKAKGGGYKEDDDAPTSTSTVTVAVNPVTGVSDQGAPVQLSPRTAFSSQASQLMNQTSVSYGAALDQGPSFTPPQDAFLPCQANHMSAYMNRLDVVKALHANPDSLPWKDCSDRVRYSFKDHMTSQVSLYKEVLEEMKDTTFDFLVFSGDDDSICSLAGTQAWIWDIGASWKDKNVWNPWVVENQTAGYLTQFDVPKSKDGRGKGSFTLVTVHGAGHEVPAYRPFEALEMLRLFLSGAWRL